MTHGSLFTGIGGFDLGFEWAGIRALGNAVVLQIPYIIGKCIQEAETVKI